MTTDQQDQNPVADTGLLASSLKVGALSAFAGFTYGGASGILRATKHPIVHSLSHSIHWAAWGSSFWWIRSNILHLHFQDHATPRERVYSSTISGGLSGGIVTRLMGGKFIPGLVVFSLVGCLGQSAWNVVQRRQQENEGKVSKPILQRMAESKWIPLRSLSDDEFKHLLNEKVLSIEAEMALLDEKIEGLQRERDLEINHKGAQRAEDQASKP
ncbi:hypothetical protein BGW36DRAFT_367205 [Talaromyces proteolyticus]|uniref:Uncharacterized protein n=1 Tax=Talaromyces proteolyticus TaxID=1131652 RepID=A0AAD4L0D8_9EURO|nr:uncharacterized protein BGW36DRAFT_367205 [Talaromyces proteolyticus]KAH8705258.1 hypothetical protein BGW36DRAFT_367205 [Talaromyces proteolyticus]